MFEIPEDMFIGVRLCPTCGEIIRRCIHPIYGWIKYICDNCNLLIPRGVDARYF